MFIHIGFILHFSVSLKHSFLSYMEALNLERNSMFEQVVSILFPVFALASVGFAVGRWLKPDFKPINRINEESRSMRPARQAL